MKSLIFLLSATLISLGTAFAQEQPSVDTRVIERPTYYPGDWWELRRPNGLGRQEVRAIGGGKIVLQITGITTAPDEAVFTEEMNLLSGQRTRRNGRSALVAYDPHSRYLSFPLHPGKKWGGEVTLTVPGSLSYFTYQMDGEVVGWGKITVGKTDYDALRIEYKNSDSGASTC
jgi:hypothetical protein